MVEKSARASNGQFQCMCGAESICWTCAVSTGECKYLSRTRHNKPCFYEGTEYLTAEIDGEKYWSVQKCPKYQPLSEEEKSVSFFSLTHRKTKEDKDAEN